VSRLFRLSVAVALTAYILWKAHPGEVLRTAAGADWTWIAAALTLLFVDRTLMAYRWAVLLCALTPGSRPPLAAITRIFFISTFVGTFLPSVGGDLYRAYSLARLNVSGVEAAASVLMDRVLGVLSIVMLGVAALSLSPHIAENRWVPLALLTAAGACAVVAAAVFSERVASRGQSVAARLPSGRARRLSAGIIDAVRRYARHHGELARVLAMSLAVQTVRVIQAWCLGRALGLEVPILLYFVFVPIVLLIMLLPITVNGLGTSQAAFVWLFEPAGVSAAEAFALSVLFVALGVVGNLPGGILYVLGTRAERHAT
jgi:uncharacterized protein (TIRG00374 family)